MCENAFKDIIKMEQVVTKEKHPGRVASGKKLVEWNRKNKKKLQEPKEEPKEEPKKEPSQEPQVTSSYKALYVSGGAVIIIAVAAAWYFLRKEVKTTLPPSPAAPLGAKKDDIFSMR